MKITMITGSPHKKGTSAMLAEQFSKGATLAGHKVFHFDAANKGIHPCLACDRCHNANSECAFSDSMLELNPKLLEADVVVFVSPIYYYNITAQIKAVIDRFYASDAALRVPKKAVLMLTFADETIDAAKGTIASFQAMTKYLGWEMVGIITAAACATVEDIKKTDYPKQAFELGKSLGS